MKRMLLMVVIAGCVPPAQPPAPEAQVRVDTVFVVDTLAVPQPQGALTELCLSTGVTVEVHVTEAGDTLIGEPRVPIGALRPAADWTGQYADRRGWYIRSDAITFDRRSYRKAGVRIRRACDELKLVGQHDGIPVFAEITAPQNLPVIIIPVRPGEFQDYSR